jgi:hypothetical protein
MKFDLMDLTLLDILTDIFVESVNHRTTDIKIVYGVSRCKLALQNVAHRR